MYSFEAKVVIAGFLQNFVSTAVCTYVPQMARWKAQCKSKVDHRRWNQTVTSLVHALLCVVYSLPLLSMYTFGSKKAERYECPSAWGCPATAAAAAAAATETASTTSWEDSNSSFPHSPANSSYLGTSSASSFPFASYVVSGSDGLGICEEWLAASFCGYIVIDFIIDVTETLRGKREAEPEALLHHAVFLLIFMLNYVQKRWCFMYYALVCGETSTVFLDVRWLMVASGNTKHLKPVNILFALTFFAGRVLVYGLCLAMALWQDKNVFADHSMWQLAPAATIIGYALNCFWFSKIVAAASGQPESSTLVTERSCQRKEE